jgi:ketosteroid isomerase-like protein
MSQENVDALRGCLEAANRKDVPGVLRFMDSEIQFECQVAPLQGRYVGHDGVQGFFADITEHFEDLQLQCPDIRDLGDRVLALGTARALGKGSGIDVETPLTVVARFREGRMTDYTDFGDRARALEAAGLREEADPPP